MGERAVSTMPDWVELYRSSRCRLPVAVLVSGILWLAPEQPLEAQRLDAVFANRSSMANSVCLNDGDAAHGAFGAFACSDLSDSDTSNGVALGFVDDDLLLDAVFANDGQNRVCLGDGRGGFACAALEALSGDFRGVALGFVNGDLNLDAVFASYSSTNRVCLGDGQGGFGCSDISTDQHSATGVALGHLDNDGNLDAMFSNAGDSPLPPRENSACFGDGIGGFSCGTVSADLNRSFDVALGHVDGDQHLDAVFANSPSPNRVCLGDGAGGFSCADISIDADVTLSVALGFLDGDAHLDAVFGNTSSSGPNQRCLGDGGGGFLCSEISADLRSTSGLALGLVNGDQHLDLVLANSSAKNQTCLGDGAGDFVCSDFFSNSPWSRSVALGQLGPEIFWDGFESGDLNAW